MNMPLWLDLDDETDDDGLWAYRGDTEPLYPILDDDDNAPPDHVPPWDTPGYNDIDHYDMRDMDLGGI